MKKWILFAALIVAALPACAYLGKTPSDLAHIQLVSGDSPVVQISKIWIERDGENLLLKGYVLRRHTASDTTKTHLQVTVYDQAGNTSVITPVNFEPRQIPRRWRMPDSASYQVPLTLPASQIARIDVRAHEDKDSQPKS